MSDDLMISRRAVLKLAVAATVSLVVGARLPAPPIPQQALQDLLPEGLSALFRHQESARVIGAAYLQKYPQERDTRFLIDQIVSSTADGDAGWFGGTSEYLFSMFDRMTREDFAYERVVQLQGWVLSVTEARLCALTTLV